VPALSSSLISPALEQLADLPAGDRELLAAGHPGPGLLEYLARVPDPHDPRCVRHSLCSLLAAAIAAVLAGSRSFAAIGEWIADAPPSVLASLGIRRDPLTRQFRPPDEATIRRVLEAVDAEALDRAAGAWLSAQVNATRVRTRASPRRRAALAVDGKAVRGTRHASADGQAVHLMAVLDHQACAVLGQVDVDGKTNEISRFRPLLAELGLTGCVITADALHTQRDHAEFLVQEKKAHYIFIVKKNQPGFHAQLRNLPWRQVPVLARQRNRGHGREESRTLKAVTVTAGLAFPCAAQAICVTRRIRPLGSRKWRTVTVYAVTSLAVTQASASQLAGWIRGHWKTGNQLHWVRDVTYSEDASQVRTTNGPRVMATLRNLAIVIMKMAGAANIAATCRHHARDAARTLATLGLTPP
jgi:predicted transposase YbfD/YdcC